MICPQCSKLVLKTANKICKNCKAEVHDNLSLICNLCSTRDMSCSICLKKVFNDTTHRRKTLGSGGCNSCGRRGK